MKLKMIFLIILLSGLVFPLQVIMDRACVVELNKKYVDYAKVFVRRYGRKSPYYLNIEGRNKHPWTNNITIHLLFFEYLHNEYRRTFVEMHFKLCDAYNSDPYVGKMLKKSGLTCPLPLGNWHLMNMTIEAKNFSNVWPFRKAMVEIKLDHTESNELIGIAKVYITFLQKAMN